MSEEGDFNVLSTQQYTDTAPDGTITMAPFIEQFESETKQIIAENRALGCPRPELAIVSTEPLALSYGSENTSLSPTARYVQALTDAAHRAEVSVNLMSNQPVHRLAEQVTYLSRVAHANGVVVTLPLPIEDDLARRAQTNHILSLIDTEKDVDGLNPRSDVSPATSEAALRLYHVLKQANQAETNEPALAVVYGGRGHVGSGLVRLLKDHGQLVEAIDIDTPPAAARDLLAEAKVVFSAVGKAEFLGPDNFAHIDGHKILINIGRGKNNAGKLTGDFAPELIAAAVERGWLVTNDGLGVGRLAVLTVIQRTVDAAYQQWHDNRATVARPVLH